MDIRNTLSHSLRNWQIRTNIVCHNLFPWTWWLIKHARLKPTRWGAGYYLHLARFHFVATRLTPGHCMDGSCTGFRTFPILYCHVKVTNFHRRVYHTPYESPVVSIVPAPTNTYRYWQFHQTLAAPLCTASVRATPIPVVKPNTSDRRFSMCGELSRSLRCVPRRGTLSLGFTR